MNIPCAIVIMAKAPAAGFAKTRLIPALGPAGAAALAARLLDRCLAAAQAAALGPVDLCCAPDAQHAAFRPHIAGVGVQTSDQGEGDLGSRMLRAFERWFGACDRVLLIGTDCPALDAQTLRAAAASLDEFDAVFVPALDGGYALVGLRRPLPGIFIDMRWSTPDVMFETRRRLTLDGVSHHEMTALPDIDDAADLVHLPAGWVPMSD